jgi:hypothetical protein
VARSTLGLLEWKATGIFQYLESCQLGASGASETGPGLLEVPALTLVHNSYRRHKAKQKHI